MLLGLLVIAVLGAVGAWAVEASSASRAQPAPAILRTPVHPVSLVDVEQAIAAAYRADPGLSTFAVQDLEYTDQSRGLVLKTCSSGGAETTPAYVESARLTACAPLIYFFYSRGEADGHTASTRAAKSLYDYAITSVKGPFNARTALDEILRSWGVK